MEVQRIQLDDFDSDTITVGLLRLAANLPDYEFFFNLNRLNSFCFERKDDLVLQGEYFTYHFPVYRGYSKTEKVCYHCISNKSSESIQHREITELFVDENPVKTLIPHFSDSDFILFSAELSPDFSVILLPENLTFQLQHYELLPHEELYHIIQYYE